MIEFDTIYSVTWPFETQHKDIPQRFIVDANIIGADLCTITSIIVSGGCINILASILSGEDVIEVSSGVQNAVRGAKIKLYNSVGKCYGWVMLGDLIPATFTLSDISYDICLSACVPYENLIPATEEGMTGDWTVEGENGVTISHNTSEPLNITFGADEESFTVSSPSANDSASGNGIYSINGLNNQTITISVSNGRIFPQLENNKLRTLLVVPQMIFYSSDPTVIQPTVKATLTTILSDHSWDSSSVYMEESNGVFTVVVDGMTLTFNKINESYVITHSGNKKIDIVATKWAGCDLSDYYRTILKTSTELGLTFKLPLDPLITGSN